MKNAFKIIGLLLLVNTAISVYGQSFIDESKKWSLLFYSPSEIYDEWYKTYWYKFKGDTIFNGHTYKKLLQASDTLSSSWTYHSSWRESNDSVFWFNESFIKKEFLVYYFNLEVGDSILKANAVDSGIEYEHMMYVDSVSYKPFGNSIRKHIYFTVPWYGSHVLTWIEGVGHLGWMGNNCDFGIIGPKCFFLCYEENGELVYQNPEFNTFYINTTAVNEIKVQPKLIESFSSATGMLTIRLLKDTFGELQLFTPEGRQIYKAQITISETELCLPQSGLMIYKFTNTNGQTQTGKVLVQ